MRERERSRNKTEWNGGGLEWYSVAWRGMGRDGQFVSNCRIERVSPLIIVISRSRSIDLARPPTPLRPSRSLEQDTPVAGENWIPMYRCAPRGSSRVAERFARERVTRMPTTYADERRLSKVFRRKAGSISSRLLDAVVFVCVCVCFCGGEDEAVSTARRLMIS